MEYDNRTTVSHSIICLAQTGSKALCTFMAAEAEMLLSLRQTVNTQVSRRLLKASRFTDLIFWVRSPWIGLNLENETASFF